MDEQNPYAAPTADVTPRTGAPDTLADRGQRFAASVIDGVLALLLVVPLMLAIGVSPLAQLDSLTVTQRVLLFALGSAIPLALHGYLLMRYGQTIGKRLLGIRIVDRLSRQVPTLGHIYLWRMLPLQLLGQVPVVGQLLTIVDALFIFRKDRRCVHDIIAGTIVVQVSSER